MGNGKSKNNKDKRKGKKASGTDVNENRHSSLESKNYEDVELKWLRRTIRNEPEYFVLNNLMMCVQFFGNFNEDIQRMRQSLVSSNEAVMNEQLPPHKRVLLPDVLQEEISRNVGFTSSRQTFRPTIEPLQPVRIYVVHDNIEVTEEDDPTYCTTMTNDTTYKVLLRQTEHRGYVKLQLLEETSLARKTITEEGSDVSSTMKNDDGFYSDADSVYGSKYARKASVGLARHSKNSIRSSKYGHSRSTPNLYDEDILYEKGERHSQENIYEGNDGTDKRESMYKVNSLNDGSSSQPPEPPARNGYPGRGGYNRTSRHRHKSKIYSNHSRASSTASSGYKSSHYVLDSDSDCGCSHSSNVARSCEDLYSSAEMSKSMEDFSLDEDPDTCRIPHRCFKKVTYTSDGKVYDPAEERKYVMNSKQKRIRQALRRYNYNIFYISSLHFMRYFLHVFVNRIAENLGFDHDSIDDVKPEGSVIYCDKVIVSETTRLTMVEPYEIIPSVWSQWPEDAKEWSNRPRSTWPETEDIGKIQSYGCYIVPEGYTPKRGFNSSRDLEWQLMFPAAERYLETCMTSAQVHVYLMALMLHKTFIRPVFDTMFGLTAAHIRNKLFWMIEENDRPNKWPDHRTGECLVKLLHSLYFCISQNEPTLSDYFIRDRNLFQKVPSEHLLHTQKQLKRILENPIMYVFHAMENVRYSQEFFPKMNFEMLLKILTADTLTLINPALSNARNINKPKSRSAESHYDRVKNSKNTEDRPGGFWENARNTSRNEDDQIYATKPPVTNRTLINPRKATDSVIEISVRCGDLESTRLCALLDFFISHFIKMSERCHQYRAIRQKTIYLDHAERLSILLSEYPRYKDDARAYRDKIKVIRKKEEVTKVEPIQPQSPQRIPGEPLFSARLKNRYVEESPQRLSIVTKEARHFGIEENTYDSLSTMKAMIHDRPRAPTPSRIERTPIPLSRTTSSTSRVHSSTDKISNSSKRVPSQTEKASSSVKRAPYPAKRNTKDRESPKASERSPKNRNNSSASERSSKDGESSNSPTIRSKQEEPAARVISLVENEDDSFLTETTYI